MKTTKRVTKKSCLTCGACCVTLGNTHVFCDVTTEDEKKLGKKFVRLHVIHFRAIDMFAAILDGRKHPEGAIKTEVKEQKSGPHKGYGLRTCAMLDGSVMSKVSCRIYDKRPRVCHEAVKPGDRNCLELRRIYSVPDDSEMR